MKVVTEMEKKVFSVSLSTLFNNLESTGRGRKQVLSVLADAIIVLFSLWAAYSLRLDVLFSDFANTWYVFAILTIASLGIFGGMGVYRWVVRSANDRLFYQLLKGSCLSALALLIILFFLPTEASNPRSLFVVFGVFLLSGVIGIRMLWKTFASSDKLGEPLAIYGAGCAGQQLVNMLADSSRYRPVVFFDDDVSLSGKTLLGLPVYTGIDGELVSTTRRLDITKVVLAMPSSSNASYHKKVSELSGVGLTVLTVPGIDELVSGSASADQIRDVSVNDILGRSVVPPDTQMMGLRVKDKVVLVTGGGGSIGSELCRQVFKLAPSKLIVLDSCEANLYHITEQLCRLTDDFSDNHPPEFLPVLGSVTNLDHMQRLIAEHAVHTVYHAAAYKHVPIVEAQPDQGVAVNVFGTLNVVNAALANNVSDFVLISTDKAVRPTNSMGASKRVAELILQAKAASDTSMRISMVRFGNVLGSSGSVVPKFKRQILEGGPITLTHREVTRYFMTIPEAAQLVLQAGALAKGGDVFVLDMGAPVKIVDLAETMVRLYGKKLKSETGNPDDIDIEVAGLRPGEKLYEELFISESEVPTEVSKIYTCNEVSLDWAKLEESLKLLEGNRNLVEVRNELMKLAFLEDDRVETVDGLESDRIVTDREDTQRPLATVD